MCVPAAQCDDEMRNNPTCCITMGGGGGGGIRLGTCSAHLQFWCGKDTGNFDTPNCRRKRPSLHSSQAHRHSRRRPTSHSQASKTSGRDEQPDCRQQRNDTWLLPPERLHEGQGTPQSAQKIFTGKFFRGVQAWASWQGPQMVLERALRIRNRSSPVLQSSTAPCGSGYGTAVGRTESETVNCSRNYREICGSKK